MTGHKGNSEFYFPETLNVPRGEAEGNIEVEEKQNSLFPAGQVLKCFPKSKLNKTAKKSFGLRRLAHKFAVFSGSTAWSHTSRKFMLLFS